MSGRVICPATPEVVLLVKKAFTNAKSYTLSKVEEQIQLHWESGHEWWWDPSGGSICPLEVVPRFSQKIHRILAFLNIVWQCSQESVRKKNWHTAITFHSISSFPATTLRTPSITVSVKKAKAALLHFRWPSPLPFYDSRVSRWPLKGFNAQTQWREPRGTLSVFDNTSQISR